jgi:urease accessory protein
LNSAVVSEPWQARLELGFSSVLESADPGVQARTVLSRRRHRGPLRVQKALYPEGRSVCHTVVLHPPSGIAGGDLLELDVEVGDHAHAVLSTPGATRWYKANGQTARQHTHIRLGAGARLDWLPQENLFFEASNAELSFSLEADASATALGWDAVMLGRTARGEGFTRGRIGLASHFSRAGGTVWRERARLDGGDTLLHSAAGLAGLPVQATLWAVGSACTPELAASLAPLLPWSDQLRAGSTALPGGIVLVRILGLAMEPVRMLLERLWVGLRPTVLGVAAAPLRLWVS